MTRYRIRYDIFSAPRDSEEIFASFAAAEAFFEEHADDATDAIVSWPDAGEDI